ncbi:Uncharacterised protein [Mycobacteroides abscessus subsp. abscessus]|uniref:hypothetical protein n=1 Tax=Mycobacteroides abscessus TaxID=36809 RepID=UPI00092B29E0|nr:hypothetical protein [Mycobacteroides abscessus]SHU93681.1 Uncharacterised protein [Mycobacteroides abscessus subsp. abscessus]SHX73364.1 Uncharacterised protein [Mycobacteroides abscessus subsp. abscessus]SIG86638.1 Uncharacterised protein [Mycobacteroides abscessus subsp. abscessus]SKD18812.1 Uncharacterised protein [Mycobacteroides abscessus subsp. abscessus]SKN10004.1 Uncharacterised protein [Mycobacteroides abscessus subsp. abscessus]
MSRSEDPTLVELERAASATGEIHTITTDSIEIHGIFTPGQALVVRPGARVFLIVADDADEILDGFTSDAAEDAAACAAFDTAQSVAGRVVKAAKEAVERAAPSLRDGAETVADAVIKAAEAAMRGDK